MTIERHVQRLADYNRWMNERLLTVSATLPVNALREDRGVFFHSVLGTFNHLLVGDTIWFKRFAAHPRGFRALAHLQEIPDPPSLDAQLFDDLDGFRAARARMDTAITELAHEAVADDYEHALHYRNSRGKPFVRPFGELLVHVFNHQTHHRGQVTAVLGQMGIDYGSTDLVMLVPDANA